jgi:hypothetical protein
MKRDMDLVRDILLDMEKQDGSGGWIEVAVPGHSEDEINYHLFSLHA